MIRKLWAAYLERRRLKREAIEDEIRRAHVNFFADQVYTLPEGRYLIQGFIQNADSARMDKKLHEH